MISALQAPASITPRLKKVCDQVSPGFDPVFLDIEPEAQFQPDMCFMNVREKVETDGGEAVFGWAIYEWPRIWMEFQFHAVWRTRDGALRDITPRQDFEKVVLFLPSVSSFDGEMVDSKFFLLSNLPLVRRIRDIQIEIQTMKARAYMEAGKRVGLVGKMRESVLALEFKKAGLARQLNLKPMQNDLCPCLSRKKFKHCCGRRPSF